MKLAITLLALMLFPFYAQAQDNNNTIVLELFTSQGCSSCPPADALMKELSAQDPSLLILSFHVDYWDRLGWKDPYSSPDNTRRQYAYASLHRQNRVFTPEIIINGTTSVVGSRPDEVQAAISNARKMVFPLSIRMSPAENMQYRIQIISSVPLENITVWSVMFMPHTNTSVAAGENSGRRLESVNVVTSYELLHAEKDNPLIYRLPETQTENERLAILVQDSITGKILGAVTHTRLSNEPKALGE